MEVAITIAEARNFVRRTRRAGRRIALVPTMGALHAGHVSLIRAARADRAAVVVSIFVNPTQFCPSEDFGAYPRPIEADLSACREEGVELVFNPPVEEIYRPGAATTVHVERVTAGLCGPFRAGHFDGVCTVVTKLFNIIQPDVAYFGQKDAQQAVVIRRFTADLDLPVEIVVCPTVREADGLAFSSRNKYLSPEERKQATRLYQTLRFAESSILAGRNDVPGLVAQMRDRLYAGGLREIDYIEIVDAETLGPMVRAVGRCLIALAVHVGPARLIDNIVVDAPAGNG